MSPEAAIKTLNGPVKAQLLGLAGRYAKRVHGAEDNYKHVLKQAEINFVRPSAGGAPLGDAMQRLPAKALD
jgi:hypothetical protein